MTYVSIWGVRLAAAAAVELVGRRWAQSLGGRVEGGVPTLQRRKGGEQPDHLRGLSGKVGSSHHGSTGNSSSRSSRSLTQSMAWGRGFSPKLHPLQFQVLPLTSPEPAFSSNHENDITLSCVSPCTFSSIISLLIGEDSERCMLLPSFYKARERNAMIPNSLRV